MDASEEPEPIMVDETEQDDLVTAILDANVGLMEADTRRSAACHCSHALLHCVCMLPILGCFLMQPRKQAKVLLLVGTNYKVQATHAQRQQAAVSGILTACMLSSSGCISSLVACNQRCLCWHSIAVQAQ